MPLSTIDRGALETIIDRAVKDAKQESKAFQDEYVKRAFHIEKVEDFVFGLAYGEINMGFSGWFTMTHSRQPTTEELKETSNIVLKRLPEIRKEIFFQE